MGAGAFYYNELVYGSVKRTELIPRGSAFYSKSHATCEQRHHHTTHLLLPSVPPNDDRLSLLPPTEPSRPLLPAFAPRGSLGPELVLLAAPAPQLPPASSPSSSSSFSSSSFSSSSMTAPPLASDSDSLELRLMLAGELREWEDLAASHCAAKYALCVGVSDQNGERSIGGPNANIRKASQHAGRQAGSRW